jgi:hypothetical protein
MDPTPAPVEPTTATTDTPAFPKPLVRLTPAPGGYTADVRMVADADAEAAATAEGWQAIDVPAQGPGFQEFPKWVYHEDGRRQVVHTKDEADKLEGFTPEVPQRDEADTSGVPVPVGDAVATASPNRPPVPADRN